MRIRHADDLRVKRAVRDFYDSQEYSPQWETKAGQHYRREKLACYLKYLGPGDTVLDAGCADLNYTLDLDQFGCKLWGLDISLAQLRAGRDRARDRDAHIPLVLGDVEYLPFKDRSFDKVISMSVLPFVPAPQKAVNELARVARESISFDVPNKFCPYYSIVAKLLKNSLFGFRVEGRQFYENEIRNMLKNTGFQINKIEYKLLTYRSFPDWLFYMLRIAEKTIEKLRLHKLLGVMIVHAVRTIEERQT